jgi:glutathione peroxidase|nr:glutathione peroxidase [Kofleriaceae bacterium]
MTTQLASIPFHRADGSPTSLEEYAGKVVLVVNVASACGLTPQYTALEAVYEKYRDRGFVVVGFPCNDFGAQEPGTAAEIHEFCTLKFGVKFPVVEKIAVAPSTRHPLYKELIAEQPRAQLLAGSDFRKKLEGYGIKVEHDEDILWNFEKFLVDRSGKAVARFAPDVPPDDQLVTAAIEARL